MVAQQGLVLPRLDEFRAYLHADLSASPAGRSALHLVKLLPTVLLNSSVEHATQMLEQNRFNPGPELVALLRRVANAKPAFLRACTDANLLRSHGGLHDGNRIYFLLEGIEAAFMRTLVRELLRRVKPVSLVFIHDGLLISPEPSAVDLAACLSEASLGLHLVPPPHFQVKIEKLQHDPHPPPGPLPRRAEVQALVTTESRPTKARKAPRVKPCITFGPAALAQQCVCDRYQPLGSPLRYTACTSGLVLPSV